MHQVHACLSSFDTAKENVGWVRDFTLGVKRSRNQTLERALDRALGRGRERPLEEIMGRALERIPGRILDRRQDLAQERILPLGRIKNEKFWKSVMDDPALHSLPLEILCDLLNLAPRSQWWEALRLRGLPQVPGRITLTDPGVWQRTEEAFASHGAGETDCLHAASQLLLDVALWFAGTHNHPDQSPFTSLVRLTRHVDAPPLRVAHCIRDLAYGDTFKENDLVAMVHSTEPAYRRLFEAAFWRDPADLREPTGTKRRRKR